MVNHGETLSTPIPNRLLVPVLSEKFPLACPTLAGHHAHLHSGSIREWSSF